MQNIKDKMLAEVNIKGWLKKTNLSKEEKLGIEVIKEKTKNKELVVFTSDKSGRFTADSVENYTAALSEHVTGDTVINKKKVRDTEKNMNHHLKQFNRMFRVGSAWGHDNRVAKASTSTNIPPPPKYGLR